MVCDRKSVHVLDTLDKFSEDKLSQSCLRAIRRSRFFGDGEAGPGLRWPRSYAKKALEIRMQALTIYEHESRIWLQQVSLLFRNFRCYCPAGQYIFDAQEGISVLRQDARVKKCGESANEL